MSTSKISWAFSFFLAIKSILAFTFFKDDPQLAAILYAGVAVFFLFLCLLIILQNGLILQHKRFPPAIKYLILFFVWMLLSISWTHAQSKVIAFFYWAALAAEMSVALLLVHIGNIGNVFRDSVRGALLGSFIFGLTILLSFGGFTDDGRLGNAELLHPNAVGNQMAVAIIMVSYLLKTLGLVKFRDRLYYFSLLGFFALVLIMSFSKTSIIALVIIFLVFFSFSMSFKQKIFLSLLLPFVVWVLFYLMADNIDVYLSEAQGGEAVETLSGRTLIWNGSIDYILMNPIFGYGVISFRDLVLNFFFVPLAHAHNELLQILFTLGIIGAFFAILSYSSLLFSILKVGLKNSLAVFVFSLLMYYLIRGLTEASFIGLLYPAYWMILSAFALHEYRAPKTGRCPHGVNIDFAK